MAKKEFKPMSWIVKKFNMNTQSIEDYDVLKYREELIKQLNKKYKNKQEFADKLSIKMQSMYWSRSEYELIIEITDDNRILLYPWLGCVDTDKSKIDVTNDTSFDWGAFAKYHIGKQIYDKEAKIDIYDQLQWRWKEFIKYCWNYRHKWQRNK